LKTEWVFFVGEWEKSSLVMFQGRIQIKIKFIFIRLVPKSSS